MSWQFTNDKSIFLQIVDIIKLDIIKGKYNAGQKLPTVRDMAIEAGVNPNTMQRAFALIEQEGLIYTKRGDGRYVNENNNALKTHASLHLQNTIKNTLDNLLASGFTKKQILSEVNLYLQGEK